MILKSKLPRNQRDYEKVENWPQTEQVFELPKVDFQKHKWVQKGYEIIDSCDGCLRQGIPIPYGKMLVKEGGKYKIIDETSRT